MRKISFIRPGLIPLGLFLLALAVRWPGLGQFTTFDESRWIDRSRWFTVGLLFPQESCPPVQWGRSFETEGLGCTLQIGYPGATTMWAGSAGLLLHYWQSAPAGQGLRDFLLQLPIYALDPAVILPTRLPPILLGALFVPLFYLLARRLLRGEAALAAALLIAWHPFYSALSRVLHHDALVTTFMTLSVLALLGYWLRGWSWGWLVFSGAMGGLALLSKQTSWFLPPYVALLAGLTWLHRWRVAGQPARPTLARLGGEGLVWGGMAAATFVAFFPAMWIIPLETLRVLFGASLGLAQAGHTHYFLGQVTKDPGWGFYPLAWLLRSTPLEVIGLALLAGATGWLLFRRKIELSKLIARRPVEIALLLFVAFFLLFVTLSNKKMDRYFLPAFPVLDLLAGVGLVWGIEWVSRRWRSAPRLFSRRVWMALALAIVILAGQGWSTVRHAPYYLTYYNPLLGGLPGAARLMTVIGWGEGLNEAGAYLNQQPEAEQLQVVTERFCSMLRPFFVGQVSCLNSSVGGVLRADYLVYYYNVVQRDLAWPEQWRYLSTHYRPAWRLRLHGLDYVRIYRNPIQHQVDRTRNRLPGELRVFGYNLTSEGRLTLIWQNLELVADASLAVGVRATSGVYPEEAGAAPGERRWIACAPAPQFDEARTQAAGSIIESHCPLTEVDLSPGLYDLQLAVAQEGVIDPIETSRLAVLHLSAAGRFEPVELVEAAQLQDQASVPH